MRQLNQTELYRLEVKLAPLQSGAVIHKDSVLGTTSLVDSTDLEIATIKRLIEQCKYSMANFGS
jgi:NAD+--asparagine ADP-ribosyltransferase